MYNKLSYEKVLKKLDVDDFADTFMHEELIMMLKDGVMKKGDKITASKLNFALKAEELSATVSRDKPAKIEQLLDHYEAEI